MRLLFLGVESGTSLHRANALRRCGHEVEMIYPDAALAGRGALTKFHYETGGIFGQKAVNRWVWSQIGEASFDAVWVDNGRYVGPALIEGFKRRFGKVLNFNVDDPYGKRDRLSWALYLRSVPFYDLIAVVRKENLVEAQARGAQRVLHVWRSADEVAHAPRALTPEDHAKWDCDVSFIGTWMPERGPFMLELLRLGVPLSIRGDRWQKDPQWSELKNAWRGPGIYDDDSYAKSIQCAKISLGLLSKGNRDLHTTRSLEIPYLQGLLCAERTTEHLELYRDGEEAVFWANAAECAQKCHELLEAGAQRTQIARQGKARCISNGTLNEPTTAQVIAAVL